jgi:hypothetical protein
MGDAKKYWKGYKEKQRIRRRQRLPRRKAEIYSLRKLGFYIEEKTPFQFRINDCVDLYPVHNLYHDIKTGNRGSYRSATKFIKGFFEIN